MPSDAILEGSHKSKLQNSIQLRTAMTLYDQETARSKKPNYQQLKKTGESETSEPAAMLWKAEQSPRVTMETKPTFRGKWECFQWKVKGQCPKWDSYSFSFETRTLETEYEVRDEEDERLLPHPIRRQNRLTARDKNPSSGSGNKQESSVDESEIPCRFKFCKHPSCSFLHLLVCLNYKSEIGWWIWRQMPFPTCWGRRNDFEGVFSIVLCISKFLSKKIYSTWIWKSGNETRRHILRRHLAPI